MPFMRGVDDISIGGTGHGFKNTGVYIEDWAGQNGATGDQLAQNTLDYMVWEAADEVQFALAKILAMKSGDGTKPLVDTKRIALWGHSYGGAISIIATGAGLSPQPAVTIDLSGAVMSWPFSTRWETVLDSYASTVKNPIYFQQVLNESSVNPYSIESTTSPFRKASTTTVGAQMSVFASIAPDSDTQASCTALGTPQYQCVHNAFVGDHDSVLHRIGTALALMGRHGVK